MREIRKKSKQVIANKEKKRIEAYKRGLKKSLPEEIELWGARESRLLGIVSGAAGLSNAVLLMRGCPDPPVEIDPDTDEESKQAEAKICEYETTRKNLDTVCNTEDPTIREWNSSDSGEVHTHT